MSIYNSLPVAASTPTVPSTPTPQAPAAPTGIPTTQDALSLSPQATAQAAAAMPATTVANPQLQAQLLQIRQELMTINGELNQLEAALNSQGAPTGTPAVPGAPTVTPTTPGMPAASGGTYTVKSGDYLWKIAQQQLGDASRWKEIYDLNKGVIGSNPNLLYPGEKLRMPAAQTSGTPSVPQQTTPTPPTGIPGAPAAPGDTLDVQVTQHTNRSLTPQQLQQVSQQFGLSPDPNNIQAFLDEMDSYQTTNKGQVFGPGMEALCANQTELTQFHQSVQQIQQALNMLIQSGKFHPVGANGQPITQLPLSGTFFQVDAQGNPVKDAQGNPVMDPNFIAAITQFKQQHGVHQSYKLADGSYAINEYVGPGTIQALQQALSGQ